MAISQYSADNFNVEDLKNYDGIVIVHLPTKSIAGKINYLTSLEIHGEANEEILVEVDTRKLSNLGISLQNLSNSLISFDNKRSVCLISNFKQIVSENLKKL